MISRWSILLLIAVSIAIYGMTVVVFSSGPEANCSGLSQSFSQTLPIALGVNYGNDSGNIITRMQIPRCTSLYAAMQLAGWHMSTKSYGNLGVYIQGINGVPQSAGAYWQWYSWTGRSWSLGPVGASSYTLNSDDMILWYLASSNAGPPPPP